MTSRNRGRVEAASSPALRRSSSLAAASVPGTMRRLRAGIFPAVAALLACALLVASAPPVGAQERTRVEKLDELPRHSYRIGGKASDLLGSKEKFAPFGEEVRADLEGLLAEYEIADRSTLTGIHQTLLLLDLMASRFSEIPSRAEILRSLEDKPGPKLTRALSSEALVVAAAGSGGWGDPELVRIYEEEYRKRVAALPWAEVQETLEGSKGQLEMVSPSLLLGVCQSQFDPAVAQAGEISRPMAMQLVSMAYMTQFGESLRGATIAVLDEAIRRNRKEKPNIWPERRVDLAGREDLTPVRVVVWDTGVDLPIFSSQIWTNPAEIENGQDDDGNGFVDDLHGIAYDEHWHRSEGALYSLDGATRPVDELQRFVGGLFDLQASIDSPGATDLRTFMASMKPEEVQGFLEDLGRYTLYAHGTHVAGIALEGNPAAELLYCRLTGDPRTIPEVPTMEDSERGAASFQEAIDYFRAHGARVVNMSWIVARSSFESALEVNGVGSSPEERKRMAREMFEVLRDGLESAFRSAPEILFVGGAGNSDNDVTFDEFFPPMFDLPNLIIAGAVDQSGDATGFTSFGPTVQIYSNGFEVESYVPGGDRLKFSGTSMSSPNVANLGAKLIALRPGLTPAEVVDLILAGAEEKTEGERVLRIMNPRRSVELLEERYPR